MSSHPVAGDGPFTVGELLADAERAARQLLGRPITADGTSLLAGWEAVLAAAAEVLTTTGAKTPTTTQTTTPATALGATKGGDTAQLVTGLVGRLAEEARVVEVGQVPSRLHPGVVHLIQTWQQAAAVIQQDPWRHRDTPHPELVALRTVRTLVPVVHASQLALGGNGPGVAGLDRDEVDGLRRLLQRHEQLALRSLRALTAAGASEAQPEPDDRAARDASHAASRGVADGSPLDRLAVGLKQWGPVAIVAAADPTTSGRDLRRIAQVEAITAAGAAALVGAAGQRGELPLEAVPHLQQRLRGLSLHWQTVTGQWEWIRRFGAAGASAPVQRLSRALAAAAADVQADVPAQPGAEQGGGRPDRPAGSALGPRGLADADLVPVLQNITENSAILAEIFRRLPTRTHRHDDAGRLRPVLFAPGPTLQQIAKETYARDHDQLRPGARVSAIALDLPVASRRGDDLRALTPDAAAFLRTTGADLARAATAAEQALELATGVRPRWTAHRPNVTPPPAHPTPTPPHPPGHSNPGTGVPR